jgi:hypothetical protein
MPKPFSVFISYSHEDTELYKQLKTHLSSLKNDNTISIWSDVDISLGTDWKNQIQTQLSTAHIILLLISADFLASDFIRTKELAKALERHKANTARIIPILLRDVSWENEEIHKLQALPLSSKNQLRPVVSWQSHDEAWKKVADGIRKIANELEQKELAANP